MTENEFFIEYSCKHCNKICKNKKSLTWHERSCKNNPNRCKSSIEEYKEHDSIHICKYCGAEMKGKSIGAHYVSCSLGPHRLKWLETVSIASLGRIMSDECKASISFAIKIAFKEGRAHGWQARTKRSYAEYFFDIVFKNNKIFDKCITEYEIKNGVKTYFLDYFFPEYNLNVEIDGAQHKFRKDQDLERDTFLSIGIKVYRIPWNCINYSSGKKLMKDKISTF